VTLLIDFQALPAESDVGSGEGGHLQIRLLDDIQNGMYGALQLLARHSLKRRLWSSRGCAQLKMGIGRERRTIEAQVS
jgi:hypothetical protein